MFKFDRPKILRKLNIFILHRITHVQIRNSRHLKNGYKEPFSKIKLYCILKFSYAYFYTKRIHILLRQNIVKRLCCIHLQTSRQTHIYVMPIFTLNTRVKILNSENLKMYIILSLYLRE